MNPNTNKLIAALAGAACVLTTALVPASQAATPHSSVVSANPVDWTPNVEDGRVRNTATVDGVTVAVGDFTQVTESGSSTKINRQDIFAFDSSGKVSTTFVPAFTGSELYDVIPAGDGQSVFVAGQFSRVNDLGGTNRLVKLNVHTGAVDRTFRPPALNNRSTMLHIANGKLYVSGYFTQVAGVAHTSLIALDPQTGADTGSLKLTFSDTWNGGTVGIEEFTMNPAGTKLVAIGNFRNVNGQSRPQIAMIDTSGATAVLDTWATSRYGATCSRSFTTYMYDVDSSPDGTYFVVVTTGAGFAGTLCDAAARFEFGRTGPNQQPSWIEYSGGDTFTAVEVTGSAVYVGGHFRWMNNDFSRDRTGPGAVSRKGLAALDPRNGLPLSWNPGRLRGWGVWGFRADDQGLWISHDTDTLGGETRKRIAFMPLAGGTAVPEDRTGSLPADVLLAGADDSLAKQPFTGTSAGARTDAANGGIDWSSTRGTFMVDGVLYTGWSNGTMTYRNYDGTTFRLSRNVNLYANTGFISDLATIRAMWFDRVTGRLYYSMNGSSTLYYRYFTPESRVVGAARQVAANGGVDFSQVTGGFLAGGKLYYRDASGTVRSVNWADGPSGSSTAVSGPGVDSVNWTSQSMFLLAP